MLTLIVKKKIHNEKDPQGLPLPCTIAHFNFYHSAQPNWAVTTDELLNACEAYLFITLVSSRRYFVLLRH